MSIEKIKQLDADIQQAEKNYQAELARLDTERAEATKRRDDTTAALQAKRDALALELKLKDYPKKLVQSHKSCAVCDEPMRPFRVADKDGNVKKLWACAAGNLKADHDLIEVK